MPTFLVLGGAGQLGRAVVSDGVTNKGATVISADIADNPAASSSIVLDRSESAELQTAQIVKTVGDTKVDAVIVVAGGWAGGNPSEDSFFKGFEFNKSVNFTPPFVGAAVAAKVLKPKGVLLFTGAAAATGPTSFMLAYGAAKAATHFIVKSLAQPGSGVPEGTLVAGFLPVTIDTPQNRAGMPDGDTSSWTPLPVLAAKYNAVAAGEDTSVANGALVGVYTKDSVTTYKEVAIGEEF